MSRTASGIVFALAVLAWTAPPALAASTFKTEHVEAELVTDDASAVPGKPTLVGLKLRMAQEWHTYWKNPGDSGLPTKIKWTLPEGWKAGEIQWPYPQPLPVGPLMNYGYDDEVVLLSELTPPANAPEGPASLKAACGMARLQGHLRSREGRSRHLDSRSRRRSRRRTRCSRRTSTARATSCPST